ncbi:MAG: mechanosensitive ion channel domain-containing protein [Halobacteriaceae archaeon]
MVLAVLIAATTAGQALERFIDNLQAAGPRILSGIFFLVLAAVLVQAVLWVVRAILRRSVPDQAVYRQFATTVIAVFLWFGVALAFLSIIGLDGIATALGTASGFLALGVSYALSGMLADAVAGIYLLRDPDFNPGDRVTAGDMTGTVQAIELRKTRFDVEGDIVVRANADVEKRWTRRRAEDDTDPSA